MYIAPWSVMASAGIFSFAAFFTAAPTLHAPSSVEYSV